MYFAMYNRLNVHVGASNVTVIRAMRGKFNVSLRRAQTHREARKNIYRRMIAEHMEARELYRAVMGGRF